MKVGVGLPFKMPTDSWAYISELARRADEGPYSSFSALDRLAYDNFEAMAELAAVAAITKRLRLLTAILLVPVRNAGVLAKQAATIDAISNGRLSLGLAVGGREDDAIVAPAEVPQPGQKVRGAAHAHEAHLGRRGAGRRAASRGSRAGAARRTGDTDRRDAPESYRARGEVRQRLRDGRQGTGS